MSLNRYAKRRDKNEPQIIDAFKSLGCTVYSIDTPCDLLVGLKGINLLVEVKTATGRFKPKQIEFIKSWKGTYCVVRTTDEAIQLIQYVLKNSASQSLRASANDTVIPFSVSADDV